MQNTNPFPWYALRVKHRHEKSVLRSLEAKGYEGFLPLYNARRRVISRRFDVELPLFPGYVFCRFNIFDRLPLLIIPGVFQVVRAGKLFPAVDESEIAAIRSIISAGLARMPWPFLKAGQNVCLDEGPLRGLSGILISVDDTPKVVVSLTLLQRSVAVEIDRKWVYPTSASVDAVARQAANRNRPGVFTARQS